MEFPAKQVLGMTAVLAFVLFFRSSGVFRHKSPGDLNATAIPMVVNEASESFVVNSVQVDTESTTGTPSDPSQEDDNYPSSTQEPEVVQDRPGGPEENESNNQEETTVVPVTETAVVQVQKAALDYENCTGADAGTGQILEINCPPFDADSKKLLKKGETYNFTVKFIAGEDSRFLTPEIYGLGIIPGVRAPFKGVERNACKSLAEDCPLVAGNTYTYDASIKILSSYPAVALTFQWGLKSINAKRKAGKNQICFQMPVQIVAA